MKFTLKATLAVLFTTIFVAGVTPPLRAATHMMEYLDRGVVAVRTSGTEVFVSWRMLGTDPTGVSFNLYRSTNGGAAVALNGSPLTAGTNFNDNTADLTQPNAYFVRPILSGVEQAASGSFTLIANAPVQQYLRVPLQRPATATMPDGTTCTYSPNDCSVGDLDGDGEYEIVVKWDPSNSQDNSFEGFTGNVFIDAYKLNGTLLWRIDLGKNIRAGAHYTQFQVYDLDGDGKAELACKTADGTVDGVGTVIGDASADWRDLTPNPVSGRIGYVLRGPEFLTIFNGQTGAALATTNYIPPRGTVNDWGDNYGNRVDRFLAGVAYLDGQRPSLIMCRGYYTRAVVTAWDWRNGQLTQRWVFDTGNVGTPSPLAAWRGQGSHSLTIGDVDGDGRDEITYGAAAIDDDGTGLYSTTLGHGDALHMSDMDPTRPGQEVWMVHEEPASYGPTGLEFRDARTGTLIFGLSGQGADVGRGVAGDIDPRFLGYEMWGSRGGLMTANGTEISPSHPSPINFMIWWDGDLLREFLDGTTISKWNWLSGNATNLLSPAGLSSNNSTKATPNLSADLFGDWREEVIWRENSNDALRIYTTTIPTTIRMPTLMHDRQYREAIAWQNTAYNQPPHPSFYLGEGMTMPPPPDIVTSLAGLGVAAPAVNSINRFDPSAASTGGTSVIFRVTFNTAVTGVDTTDFTVAATGSIVGTVSNVTPLSAYAYNVTVGSITGTGTLKLDLKASGTGITGPGGVPISGGFTSGQSYARATLAWTKQTTGGLWSDAANWDGGVIADGLGAVPTFGNFDLLANNTVLLDTPRTISGFTFGDTGAATSASWIIADNGSATNVLTLDVATGSPLVTVNALGTGATVTFAVTVDGTDGFTKAGAGTLVLTKPETFTGVLNVNAGVLRLDSGSSITLTDALNVSTTANSTLQVNGGSFTTSGLATLGGGNTIPSIFRIDSGTAALNGGIRTNNDAGSAVRVAGGTFTATDVNIRRNSAAPPDFATGFVITGGTSTVGTIGLGTNNSTGAMSVEGGSLTATGVITVANQITAARGGAMRVTGGTFVSSNTASGIVLSRTNGTNANNVAAATFSGGTSTVEKFTLGFDSTVNAGTATLTFSGGTVYLGSGGIVKNGVAPFVTTVNLTSGILGAKADWSVPATVPLTLTAGGTLSVKAADAADVPHQITFGSVVSGSGQLNKTGAGTLVLGAVNTFNGPVAINAGILRVDGSTAAGSAVAINSGGVLGGTGTVNGATTLNSGGAIAPGTFGTAATLNGAGLTWNAGGKLALDLGATGVSDKLALSGALTKGTAGTFEVAFNAGTGFALGNTYTLATFASTSFLVSDFSATGLPAGTAANFSLSGTSLQVTIVAPTQSYAQWVAFYGLAPAQSGFTADGDADGVNNLLEYYLGLNPTLSESAGLPVGKVEAGEFVFRYTHAKSTTGVTAEVQTSTDLIAWSPAGVAPQLESQTAEVETLVVKLPLTAPRLFARLVITAP